MRVLAVRIAVLTVTFLALVPQSHAAPPFEVPQPGSRDRRAILAAIRPQVEAAFQEKLKFEVRSLDSNGEVALVFVVPRKAGGAALGPRTTTNDQGETRLLSNWVFAIVKKEGKAWQPVEVDMVDGSEILISWRDTYPEIPRKLFDSIYATYTDGEW